MDQSAQWEKPNLRSNKDVEKLVGLRMCLVFSEEKPA